MKRVGIFLVLVALAIAVPSVLMNRSAPPLTTRAVFYPTPVNVEVIVAPGRVEPVSEEVKVSSQIPGTLSRVPFDEGSHVRRGQVIAVISNEDYQARVASAEAQLKVREAELLRITNGSRDEERRKALAGIKEAEAILAHAELEQRRRRELHQSGAISRSEAEHAQREHEVAVARLNAAREHHSFVDAAAREDDRMRAEAEVAVARASLLEARALLAKTEIRSPLNGVVLRRHMRAGESISELLQSPIYTLADTSVLRVRVDVDERDIAKIQVGRRAWFTADAYGEKKFWGRIVRIGKILGKKNIRSDEPTERVDQKILETLVELDPGSGLPIGLRVNSYLPVN